MHKLFEADLTHRELNVSSVASLGDKKKPLVDSTFQLRSSFDKLVPDNGLSALTLLKLPKPVAKAKAKSAAKRQRALPLREEGRKV